MRTNKAHLKKLEELGINNIRDLLLFFPRAYEDKRAYSRIADVRPAETHNLKGRLSGLFHKRTHSGKLLSKAVLSDNSGSVEVIWFNQPYLKRVLKNGQEIVLSGKVRLNLGKLTLSGPSFEEKKQEQTHTGSIIPVYHQTEGITSKWIREKLKPVIHDWIEHFPEYLPPEIISKYGLIPYKEAILNAHFPSNEQNLAAAKKRLSFDELFILQLKALQKKWRWQNISVHEQKPIPLDRQIIDFIKNLPYELTEAQKKSLKEILADLSQKYPMSRLLQGDVGSGKTIVAAIAVLNTLLSGRQAAFMAPTEILAKQHHSTFHKLFRTFGYNIQFLSGSIPQSQKDVILSQLQSGTVDLIIGTHSLIQEGVNFHNLGLAVIDEQHRFGVKQRDKLKSFGSPHLLSLSATPIPRTLAMTIYGDQDLSLIEEMPAGRQPIITRIVPENKRTDAYRWIDDQVKKGRQAYLICPLIDESDSLELKSAINEYEFLQNSIFPHLKLGLLHGRMKAQEKEEIMGLFKENFINILVSTSVIEVGIDVPNSSIMVIEGAERFGLSQLHQFRGRVGRGEHQSYCFLFTKDSSGESLTRLQAMVQHSSGFKLAEIDLSIRGPGEIFGVRQSGIPDLKMATLTDSATINIAREAATEIVLKDPLLENHPELRKKVEELPDLYVND